MKIKKLSYLFLFFIVSSSSLAQNSSTEKESYTWFDSKVGIENTPLYNGVEYIDFEQGENSFKKFLFSGDFQKSMIEYENQRYFDIPLKYDVFNDQIIIKLSTEQKTTILQLFKEKVGAFQIGSKSFQHIKNLSIKDDSEALSGFYEVVYNSSQIQLLKKYRKTQLREIRKRKLYFKYKFKTPYYYVMYNQNVYEVKNQRDFIKIFPELKNMIQEVSVDRSLRNSNPDAYMLAYINQINVLLSKK